MKSDLPKSLWRRVMKVFSWVTGISLSALLLSVFGALFALAIFVRTDFFKNKLRDQVLSLARESLNSDITFDGADVAIFAPEPRIEITNVRFFNRETKVEILAEKVGVSISPVLTVPLLLFNQLHLSSVSLEGVSYDLQSTRPFVRLLDRFRPKEVFVPSALQTTIRRFVFRRIKVSADLPNDPRIPFPLSGDFFLNQLEVAPGRSETSFSADLELSQVRLHNLKNLNGTLSVSRGILRGDRLQLNRFEFKNESDYIVFSGRVGSLASPDFDIEGRSSLELSRYLDDRDWKGALVSDLRLAGPVSNLEARGRISSELLTYRGMEVRGFEAGLHLQNNVIRLSEAKWRDSENGVFSVTASLPLTKEGGEARLDLSLDQVSLKSSLLGFSESLRNWQARLSGTASYEGNLWEGAGRWSSKIGMTGVELRTRTSNRLIHSVDRMDLEASGELAGFASGRSQFSIKNDLSRWEGLCQWKDGQIDLQWKTDFLPVDQVYGRFFYYALKLAGSLEGSLTGPLSDPVLRVVPRGLRFQMDDLALTNLTGLMTYQNNQLRGEPLRADGVEIVGGIQFTSGGREDEFSDLKFQIERKSLATLFSIFQLRDNWNRDLDGLTNLSGRLSGSLLTPSGTGRILLRDWTYRKDQARGRIARTDWVADRGRFDFLNLRVFTSADSAPLQGEIELDDSGLREARVRGDGFRLGEWFYLFGVPNLQSLAKVELDYLRDRSLMTLNLVARETSLGGSPQKDSQLQLRWEQNDIQASGRLFGEKIRVDLNSRREGALLRSNYSLAIDSYDFATLLPRTSSRVTLEGVGEAKGEFVQAAAGLEMLPFAYLERASKFSGTFKVEKAELRKGSIPLLELKPFDLQVMESGRASWTPILLVSDGYEARLTGFYTNPRDFRADLNGSLDLRSLSALFSELSRSDGRCDVNGSLGPRGFSGLIRIENGILNLQGTPFVVRNVESVIRSQESQFRIESFRGEFRDGDFSATGGFRFSGWELENLRVQAQLSQSLIQPQPGLSFKLSGPLDFRFERRMGEIRGKLDITEGAFRSRFDLRPDLFSGAARSRLRSGEVGTDPLEHWKLNVDLNTQAPVTIRNNSIDGAVTFRGGLSGTLLSPSVRGSAEILRGQFKYFNRTFDVTSGAIQFRDPSSNIPNYDIRAETEIGEYRIFLIIVGGPPKELKINFSSDPALSERDILSVISSGQPASAIEQQGGFDENTRLTGFTGLSLVTGALQDKIEGRLTRDLGIRRFYLVPAFSDESRQTELQLTVGADLIPNRLQIDYSNFLSIEGGHKVELDFKVSRMISLVGSWRDVQSQDRDDFGGDILFRFESE